MNLAGLGEKKIQVLHDLPWSGLDADGRVPHEQPAAPSG